MAVELLSEEHGGIDPRELNRLGIAPEELLDFSVNSNPFGPSPQVLKAIRTVDISRYPDRECLELREMLADANRVAPKQVLVGNGTAELIWLVVQALLQPGDGVLIVGPTFSEYGRAVMAMGGQIEEIHAGPPRFIAPIEQIVQAISRRQPRLVFLCNPNNPTGQYIPPADIEVIINACGSQTYLVIDEAYKAFASGENFGILPGEQCILLRS